jgi:hypothetical protein
MGSIEFGGDYSTPKMKNHLVCLPYGATVVGPNKLIACGIEKIKFSWKQNNVTQANKKCHFPGEKHPGDSDPSSAKWPGRRV